MRPLLLFAFILAAFSGCTRKEEFVVGCPLAPPSSNFPDRSTTSMSIGGDDSYFNIQVLNNDYQFKSNKVNFNMECIGVTITNGTSSCALGDAYGNAIFRFYIVLPNDDQSLYDNIGVKQPLKRTETLFATRFPELQGHFSIHDYCNDFNQVVEEDISQSYYQFNSIELENSVNYMYEQTPVSKRFFFVTGELYCHVLLNGKSELVKAEYRMRFIMDDYVL
ncbi:MAG: hypothetical protein HOP08_14835 [Cyclobacteriaceae bacterium]|nr:hypothetical protein [Cyclobacteriaceae bacterium]